MVAMELEPVGRFEWERWIRRLILPPGVKYTALMAITYGDLDGSRVFPGVEKLALVMNVGTASVKRHMRVLRETGLIQRVKQGNRHAEETDEYRITLPSNLLDLPMLTPDEEPESGDHG
ncbi:hypothetical protein [Nocardia abscessus]|uniref:hypothetical protein n=1 Tax=Nocardia abscessus TaxID=120957 RepID=UPI0024543AD1|nr:hypothetical protein [Nocardia abscessus]